MLQDATIETFMARRGEHFRLRIDDRQHLLLTLSEVQPLSGDTTPGGRRPFSLLFHEPSPGALPQNIYRLDNDNLPAMDVFLVPLGPDERGMRYEAIFT